MLNKCVRLGRLYFKLRSPIENNKMTVGCGYLLKGISGMRGIFNYALLTIVGLLLGACTGPSVPATPSSERPTAISTTAVTVLQTPPPIAKGKNANEYVPVYNASFQVGDNFGYQDGWNNQQYADLTAALGMTTTRISLPKDYLEKNGYNAERSNVEYYRSVGLTNLTCFLSPYVDGHYKIPANLYAPTFVNGKVNPANDWATYVAKVVQGYGDIVKIWEVWNEPDFTNDSSLAEIGGAWNTRLPKASETTNWNGPITSYIHLLRVTYEVVHALQPDGFVATGGITYESYLKWILSLTDNPNGGTVTESYPLEGGAYFDVLSFHQYPIYSEQDWQNGKPHEFLPNGTTPFDIANWTQKVKNLRYVLAQYGYDNSKFPSKIFINTETGVPWQWNGNDPPVDPVIQSQRAADSSVALITAARQNGVMQIHFYQLNDSAKDNENLDDPFQHMGMYHFLTVYGSQRLTSIGSAVRTALGK